jgi:DNA-binding response OmpR family regulator
LEPEFPLIRADISVARERAVLLHWAFVNGFGTRVGMPAESSDPRPCVLVTDRGDDSATPSLAEGGPRLVILDPNDDERVHLARLSGATDFLVRPYCPAELFLRVRRCLELATKDNSAVARRLESHGAISVDADERTAFVHGRPVPLRRAEFLLLRRLLAARPAAVTQHEIMADVLGSHGDGASARNQVYELRKKLARAGVPNAIVTLRGEKAYRLA